MRYGWVSILNILILEYGSSLLMKQLVGDKLDSRSILCYFVGYPRNSAGYYFYHPQETNVFVSRNATLLERDFLLDRKGQMIELEEVREKPTIIEPTPDEPREEIQAPSRYEKVSRPPMRYGQLLEEGHDEPNHGCDPWTFKEALSDANSSK